MFARRELLALLDLLRLQQLLLLDGMVAKFLDLFD